MNIEFKWVGGGNWILTIDALKMVCDPVLCPLGSIHDYRYFRSKRINSPFFSETDLENVDVWLFTHGHKDHCDLAGKKPITDSAKLIADISASKVLSRKTSNRMEILSWGEKTILTFPKNIEIAIEAIPAIHGLNDRKGKLVGNGNGYWIDICRDQKKYSIYATGDTLPSRETVKAVRNRCADLCIANVGNATVGRGILSKFVGRITMNMGDLVSFRKLFSAGTTIPIHWDAFEHYRERDVSKICEKNGIQYIQPGEKINLTDQN